ncbi:MAG: hypothetical protein ACQER7_04930 [Bacteroidota bacterium]
MKHYKSIVFILFLWAGCLTGKMGLAQSVPAEDENIPYLVTFGGDGDTSWGDDDFCQIFFAKIPESTEKPIYIRVYDPDTGGELDEKKEEFNTSVEFSIYGGEECWTHEDAKNTDPVGNYKSGILLDSKIFSDEEKYDEDWYVFGPFNPQEGEYVEQFEGYVFKIIAEGVDGNDGNLYRYFLSSAENESKEIEGGNLFTYEYTFRLWNNQNNVSQIYPYIDDKTTAIEIKNFDWDDDGYIRLVSVAKNGKLCTVTGEDEWAEDRFPVHEAERNSSMELQFIKDRNELVKNNNVVVVVQNQYGENLPFYVVPIGGIPSYQPEIRMEVIDKSN